MSSSFLVLMQAAPAAADKKANGTAAAAVQAVEEEATPSHDVYGHLPKPEENDKVGSLSQGTCRGVEGGGGMDARPKLGARGERGECKFKIREGDRRGGRGGKCKFKIREADRRGGRGLYRRCPSVVNTHACKLTSSC